MGKSYKRTPISGSTSNKGQKKFRSQENRAKRRAVSRLLHTGREIMPHEKEYGNEWDSPRDGKHWYGEGKYLHTNEKCLQTRHCWCYNDYIKSLRR